MVRGVVDSKESIDAGSIVVVSAVHVSVLIDMFVVFPTGCHAISPDQVITVWSAVLRSVLIEMSHTRMIIPAVVVDVMVQGQGSHCQKQDESHKVVDYLEERLISSSRTPNVRDEKRESNQNETANRDQPDVVTILEWSIGQFSTKIKGVNSNKDDGRHC